MKKIILLSIFSITLSLISNNTYSQKWLDKLEKRVDRKVDQKERETERKIERKVDNKIDKGIDDLLSGKWLKRDRNKKYPPVESVQNSKAGKEIVKIEQNIEDFYINFEEGKVDEAAKNIDNVDNYLLKAKSKDGDYDYSEYEAEQVKMNGLLFGDSDSDTEQQENESEEDAED